MELQGKIALITGASGFVGGHVARRLAETEGMRVRALIRNPGGDTVVSLDHPGIELVKGDILDPESLEAACADATLVVHAAITWTRNAAVFRDTIIEGTRNLYEAASAAGTRQFIFMSSMAVYGGIIGQYEDREGYDYEEIPLVCCGNLYADSKIIAEKLLFSSSINKPIDGPKMTVLRAGAVYGPGSRIWVVKLIEDAKKGQLFLPGGGNFFVSYVYIDNLIDAVVAAARVDSPSGAYDILDGRTSYREFVEPFAGFVGGSPRFLPMWVVRFAATFLDLFLWLGGKSVRNTRVSRAMVRAMSAKRRRYATADKARRELGWNPRVDIVEGMRRTEAWLRERGYIN